MTEHLNGELTLQTIRILQPMDEAAHWKNKDFKGTVHNPNVNQRSKHKMGTCYILTLIGWSFNML